MNLKKIGIRVLEVSLAAHGVLHFVELISALYEEAYMTATLAAFGGMTMVLGALLLEGHHHHH
jgi:hypothetical protein